MFHRIKEIVSLDNLYITVIFVNGTEKIYDVRQMIKIFPQMKKLEKADLFEAAVLDPGGYGISWNDLLDIDAVALWDNGKEIKKHSVGLAEQIGLEIVNARTSKGITQKELAKITGINQSDISKLERGYKNPSINLLSKIADGLNMKIDLHFNPIVNAK